MNLMYAYFPESYGWAFWQSLGWLWAGVVFGIGALLGVAGTRAVVGLFRGRS